MQGKWTDTPCHSPWNTGSSAQLDAWGHAGMHPADLSRLSMERWTWTKAIVFNWKLCTARWRLSCDESMTTQRSPVFGDKVHLLKKPWDICWCTICMAHLLNSLPTTCCSSWWLFLVPKAMSVPYPPPRQSLIGLCHSREIPLGGPPLTGPQWGEGQMESP